MLVALVAVTTLGPATRPAAAHETPTEVVTLVSEIEPSVEGLTVQVVQSVSTQLVLTNETEDTASVLDDAGRAFLRIGGGVIEANVDVAAWFLSNDPVGEVSDLPPRAVDGFVDDVWIQVAEGDRWGWFDHRLHPETIAVPGNTSASEGPAVLGRWTVPIIVGDVDVEVRGVIEFRPPVGTYLTLVLVSPEPLAATVLEGPAPGLFAERRTAGEVIVLGGFDEPMLRFRDGGVDANWASPTWHETARAMSTQPTPYTTASAVADADWHEVAAVDRFGWLDPRIRYPTKPPDDPTFATTIARWSIPMLIGDQQLEVGGESRWQPIDSTTPVSTAGADGTSAWRIVLIIATSALIVAAVIALLRRELRPADMRAVRFDDD
ncbi:MAG TPA: hypothetical protein VGA13_01720 [Acidimicrobiales bacterium]